MDYKEIVDTIKVGDYVDVKGGAMVADGIYPVQRVDCKSDTLTLLVSDWWLNNKYIVRKVSQEEAVKNIEKQTTEAQDSQNENDSSQSGSEIVVGSTWIFTNEDDEDGFSKGKIYSLGEIDEEGYFGVVNDWEETIWFSDSGISTHFKPVEQSTDQSTGQYTDTLKDRLASEEASGGVLKILKEWAESEADTIISLQYDPKDVAFTSERFPVCKAVYSVDIPTRHEQPRNKYDREVVKGVFVDVYDVLAAFEVTDPCLQHLIKKALAVGIRGHKDAHEDYTDILDSSKRALEKYEEKSL